MNAGGDKNEKVDDMHASFTRLPGGLAAVLIMVFRASAALKHLWIWVRKK